MMSSSTSQNIYNKIRKLDLTSNSFQERKRARIVIDSKNRKKVLDWVREVLENICDLSPSQKIMIFATCDRIINSYINTFKIMTELWKVIAISTIWLAIKAYCIDEEEEEEWYDAEYMASLFPGIKKEKIIEYEIMIFRHLNWDVNGPEKRSLLNPHYNKNDFLS